MPVRKIPKNYRSVTGVAAALKAVGDAEFESTLERDFVKLLECNGDVARIEVQPIKIEWTDELNKPRGYTPDVFIEFKPETGRPPWLCEVKYRADLRELWPELRPKLARGMHFARQRGWLFHIFSEVEIRTPYLTNVVFLEQYRSRVPSEEMSSRLLESLEINRRTTPRDLVEALSTEAISRAYWLPVLWHLVTERRVGVDLDSELTMDASIWSLS
jgi:hypothetical protein